MQDKLWVNNLDPALKGVEFTCLSAYTVPILEIEGKVFARSWEVLQISQLFLTLVLDGQLEPVNANVFPSCRGTP